MYDLSTQAEALVETLEMELTIGTVAYIDEDSQSANYPATLPAAFVVMEKIAATGGSKKSGAADITWTVIVRGKKLNEADESVLPVVDMVIDALVGLRPLKDVATPLQLLGVDYHDKQAESVAYAVRFLSKVKSNHYCTR